MKILSKIKRFFQLDQRNFNVDRFEQILSESVEAIRNKNPILPHSFERGSEIQQLFMGDPNYNVISATGSSPLVLAFICAGPMPYITYSRKFDKEREVVLFAPNFYDTILKSKNLDLNFKLADGETVLHYVTLLEESFAGKWVERLVEQGADANAKDNNGNTPFHIAMMGHDEYKASIFYNFVEAGWMDWFWDKTIKNNLGQTPLFCAAANPKINGMALGYEGECSIFEHIKGLGWDPAEVDSDGNTALHVYTQNLSKFSEYYEITHKNFNLTDFENVGVDVWKRNNAGQTFFELLKPEVCSPEFFKDLLEQSNINQNKYLLECVKGGAEETAPKPKRRM